MAQPKKKANKKEFRERKKEAYLPKVFREEEEKRKKLLEAKYKERAKRHPKWVHIWQGGAPQ